MLVERHYKVKNETTAKYNVYVYIYIYILVIFHLFSSKLKKESADAIRG